MHLVRPFPLLKGVFVKIGFRIGSLIFFCLCIAMLVTDFFKPCDEGRGTGMYCLIPVGNEAVVDQPARISFFSWDYFKVEQHNQDNTVTVYEPLNINGDRYLEVVTDQPTTWLVTKAGGGMFHSPTIHVYQVSDQYPSLVVHRTGYRLFTQLIGWSLFPIFISPFLLGILLLILSFK